MTALVHAVRLTVTIGGQNTLDRVSLDLNGSCVAVLGGAGAGKSVLLGTLVGQIQRSEGELTVCGFDPRLHTREVRRRVTHITGPAVFEPHLTTRENVEHVLHLSQTPTRRSEIDRALRDADIPDRAIGSLSSRASVLVAASAWLAIAKLRASQLILIDDPTTYLNASETTQFGLLVHEVAGPKVGVVVATRDAPFAEACASTIYRLESGRLSGVSRHGAHRSVDITPSH